MGCTLSIMHCQKCFMSFFGTLSIQFTTDQYSIVCMHPEWALSFVTKDTVEKLQCVCDGAALPYIKKKTKHVQCM